VKIVLVVIYGYSAGHAPNQVNRKKTFIKVQNTNRDNNLNLNPLKNLLFVLTVNKNKIKTEAPKATTPPNLFGIARRIA